MLARRAESEDDMPQDIPATHNHNHVHIDRRHDLTLTLVQAILGAVYFYYLYDPDSLDNLREQVAETVERVKHRFSVWQALISIRSLPEHPE